MGDKALFQYKDKRGQTTWEKCTIVAVRDKVAFVKFGAYLRRVSIDELRTDKRTGEDDVDEIDNRKGILKQSEDEISHERRLKESEVNMDEIEEELAKARKEKHAKKIVKEVRFKEKTKSTDKTVKLPNSKCHSQNEGWRRV